MRKKRDLFDELVEGFDALADQRGRQADATYACGEGQTRAKVTARELAKVREDTNLSRGHGLSGFPSVFIRPRGMKRRRSGRTEESAAYAAATCNLSLKQHEPKITNASY